MTDDEFKQLEVLLRKLQAHLGNRFCLIPESYQDGTQIGIYDYMGHVITSETGPSLKICVDKIKARA